MTPTTSITQKQLELSLLLPAGEAREAVRELIQAYEQRIVQLEADLWMERLGHGHPPSQWTAQDMAMFREQLQGRIDGLQQRALVEDHLLHPANGTAPLQLNSDEVTMLEDEHYNRLAGEVDS